jgi:hypothetical protein
MKTDIVLTPDILVKNGWFKDDRLKEYYGPISIVLQYYNKSFYYLGFKINYLNELMDILILNGLKKYADNFIC